ncbi:MAG: hypothetical protein J5691_00815 [Bacilli bacterium]|nr:hypothetical protein [Bacilli bacterium]
MYPGFEDPIEEVDISRYAISTLKDELDKISYEARWNATGAYLNRNTFGYYIIVYDTDDLDIEKLKERLDKVLRKRFNIPEGVRSEIAEDDDDPAAVAGVHSIQLVFMYEIDEETRDNIYLLSRIAG